jgi:hypothetical protein
MSVLNKTFEEFSGGKARNFVAKNAGIHRAATHKDKKKEAKKTGGTSRQQSKSELKKGY